MRPRRAALARAQRHPTFGPGPFAAPTPPPPDQFCLQYSLHDEMCLGAGADGGAVRGMHHASGCWHIILHGAYGRETELLGRLRHRNIMTLLSVFEPAALPERPQCVMVMPRLSSTPFSAYAARASGAESRSPWLGTSQGSCWTVRQRALLLPFAMYGAMISVAPLRSIDVSWPKGWVCEQLRQALLRGLPRHCPRLFRAAGRQTAGGRSAPRLIRSHIMSLTTSCAPHSAFPILTHPMSVGVSSDPIHLQTHDTQARFPERLHNSHSIANTFTQAFWRGNMAPKPMAHRTFSSSRPVRRAWQQQRNYWHSEGRGSHR